MQTKHVISIAALVALLAGAGYVIDTQPAQAPITQVPVSNVHTIARIGPSDIYPPAEVPGVLNPDITQANISQNICAGSAWSTKSIRPVSSYTTSLKVKQFAQFGYTDTNTKNFEEDHLISLELGGNPIDPANLWPEPYAPADSSDGGAHQKDATENYLHKQVCSGAMTLAQAQGLIAGDWYAVYKSMTVNTGASQTLGASAIVDPDDEQ